ncbi:hypothetical protein KEM52_003057 [Ascosphaera acerosa]|nr:hypothetical protein KEM52_003057 [Ascosphaera acerosa]
MLAKDEDDVIVIDDDGVIVIDDDSNVVNLLTVPDNEVDTADAEHGAELAEREQTLARLRYAHHQSWSYVEQELAAGNVAYAMAYAREHLAKLELHIQERQHVLRMRLNPRTWDRARHRSTMYTSLRDA